MSCLECTSCLDLGTYDICCEEVFIGRMPDAETEYLLLIKDLSLNSVIRQLYTSNVSSEVYLIPDQNKFAPNRTYEVRVYTAANCNFDDPLDIDTDISEDVQSCVSLDFFYSE
jgi:hypothetical protein